MVLDILAGLLICAVILGLIALYFRTTDAEVIDEEAEKEAEQESPEERAQNLHKQELRTERVQSEEYTDSSL
jgi:hypothetical protein